MSPFLIGALILLGSLRPASAEHVSMPFQCKLERGRVTLVPAAERTYEVLGPHRQQPHLFCAARDERKCRPRTVHRFDVMCGGMRTPWVSVAAAATRLLGHESWIESGRLNVVVGVGTAQVRSECGDTSWPRSLTQAFASSPSFDRPCNPRIAERGAPRVITLPPGFAPLTELGARLVDTPVRPQPPIAVAALPAPAPSTGPAPQASQAPHVAQAAQAIHAPLPVTPSLPSVASAGNPAPDGIVVAAASVAPPAAEAQKVLPVPPLLLHSDVAEMVHPGTAVSPSTVAAAGQPTAPEKAESPGDTARVSRWMLAVRRDESPTAALFRLRAELGPEHWLFLLGLLSATLAIGGITIRSVARGTAAALRRRRSSQSIDHLVRRASLVNLDDPDERVLADLRSTADQLRNNAEDLLDELHSAPPLRGVLRQEVDLIAQRLSEVPRSNGVVGPRQIRQRYQGGIRELHRVIKIAEGAAASFSAGAVRPKVPTSREEAYDMLGVNDSIGEATLKKLVDALRLSWHPDHARDDIDRERREERIKQINVAWDLITGKRIAV